MTPASWAVGAALACVLLRAVWARARHAITLVHEAGHALVAVSTRRRLHRITLHTDTSGLTVSSGRPRGPGMVATALAGYLAPAALGLALAALVAAGRPTAALIVALTVVAFVLVWIRNLFGLVVVACAGGLVALLIWRSALELQQAGATFLAAFLLLGAPRPTVELWAHRWRRRSPTSDADVLGRITRVPPIVWTTVFTVTTAAGALCGVSLLLLGRPWP